MYSIVTNELPSHSHTFTGTEVTTSGGSPHTHDRGTLNITGSFTVVIDQNNNVILGGGKQAFSTSTRTDATMGRTAMDGSGNPIKVTFNAANGWSGTLATESAHTHTVTAAGSNGNTGNNERIFKR